MSDDNILDGEIVYLIEAKSPIDGSVERFGEFFKSREEATIMLEMAIATVTPLYQGLSGTDDLPDAIDSIKVEKYVLARID